jgi:ribosomal protein S18 acetylase RimI-like enzyme
MTDFTVTDADPSRDLEDVKRLFRAYVDWLGIDLSYQGFEEELAALPGKYVPPLGALILAKTSSDVSIGCVALRPMADEGICEMKRLYVAPEGRGSGVGSSLVSAVLGRARSAGYRYMRLDTLPTMEGAIRLYKAAGFVEIPAYYDTPIKETVFLQCSL